MISISDPVPSGLAAELTGREEAGSLLDRLAHQTSLLTATGRRATPTTSRHSCAPI